MDSLDFHTANAQAEKKGLLTQLGGIHAAVLVELAPVITYANAISKGTTDIEQEAKKVLQGVADEENERYRVFQNLAAKITQQKETVDQVLSDAREAAATVGVSDQAIHFKDEADKHERASKIWLRWVIGLAAVLGAFIVLTLWLRDCGIFKTDDSAYAIVQVALSKVLFFSVLTYMLYLAVRNFLSHKHNAVVNRHRQNALSTYITIVNAGEDAVNRDVVLLQAAQCIFSPQATAFSRDLTSQPTVISPLAGIVEKAVKGAGGGD